MYELDRSYSARTPARRTRRAVPARFLDRAVRGHRTLDLGDAPMGLLGRHALRRAPEILAPGLALQDPGGRARAVLRRRLPSDLELQRARPGHSRTDRES